MVMAQNFISHLKRHFQLQQQLTENGCLSVWINRTLLCYNNRDIIMRNQNAKYIDMKTERKWTNALSSDLPMQNHRAHEHSQVDQSRQGHRWDIAHCRKISTWHSGCLLWKDIIHSPQQSDYSAKYLHQGPVRGAVLILMTASGLSFHSPSTHHM